MSRQLGVWAELFKVSLRLRRGYTVALLAAMTAVALLAPVNALAMRGTVNAMIGADSYHAGIAAVVAATTFGASSGLRVCLGVLMALVVEQVSVLHLQREIYTELSTIDGLEHLEQAEFLDRVTILDGAAWDLLRGMWMALDALFNIVRMVLLLVLLDMASPWLTLLLPVAAALLWFDRRGQRAVSRAETESAEAFRLQRHLFNVATDPAGAKDIRIADAAEEISLRQSAAWDQAVAVRFGARLRSAAWKAAGWSLFALVFTAGLWLVLYGASLGRCTVGDVVLTITISTGLRRSVLSVVSSTGRAAGTARLVEPYLWLRDYFAAARVDLADTAPPDQLSDGIALDHVTFTYPGAQHPAIQDLTCLFQAGSVVAIVGEYGSGKSTLVKLLAKFYRPDSGTIMVDGADLRKLDTVDWRARCSAAFQDFGRFQLRFGETVGIGDLPHQHNEERLRAALRVADAEPLLKRLPSGLATQLGRSFGGVELSEGQWQKTALARASMRDRPLLFLLDEPTASLDAPSEQAINERYISHARQLAARTGAVTVIVSHRFSTVSAADHILVLSHGSLIESGTHEYLMALQGRYSELYTIQANAYAQPPCAST